MVIYPLVSSYMANWKIPEIAVEVCSWWILQHDSWRAGGWMISLIISGFLG
jgi:hypothetical protein